MTLYIRNKTDRPIHLTVVRSKKTPNKFTFILSKDPVTDPKLKKEGDVLIAKLLDSGAPEAIPDFTKESRGYFDNRVSAIITTTSIDGDRYLDLAGFFNGNHP